MIGYQLGVENELIGEIEIQETPSGFPIIPAGVITAEPPAMPMQTGLTLIYEGDVWVEKEDHRGEQYWLPDDEYGTEPRQMDRLGEFPAGAVFTAPPEPTQLEKWQKRLETEFDPMTKEDLRAWLYTNQKYRFIDDDFAQGESDVPMCDFDDKALTVDEAKNEWLRYVGDNDAKAQTALSLSTSAKNYIRQVVSAYKGE